MKIFAKYLTLVYCRCTLAGWYVHFLPLRVRRSNNSAVKIEEGSARSLIKRFDVKKREYFGNTSMEAEISLLMANQTMVGL
jgi:hypothetical protein